MEQSRKAENARKRRRWIKASQGQVYQRPDPGGLLPGAQSQPSPVPVLEEKGLNSPESLAFIELRFSSRNEKQPSVHIAAMLGK